MASGYVTFAGAGYKNILFNNTQTANAGAGGVVTNLLTYNMPANTLTKTGKTLQGTISGFFSNNAGTDYSLYLYIDIGGANDITPTIPIPLNANVRQYIIDFSITRADDTTLQIISKVGISNSTTNILLFDYYYLSSTSIVYTTAYNIKLDATNASAGTVNGVITKDYVNFNLQG